MHGKTVLLLLLFPSKNNFLHLYSSFLIYKVLSLTVPHLIVSKALWGSASAINPFCRWEEWLTQTTQFGTTLWNQVVSPNAAASGLVVINDYVSFCLLAGVWGHVSPVGGAQVCNKCSLLLRSWESSWNFEEPRLGSRESTYKWKPLLLSPAREVRPEIH